MLSAYFDDSGTHHDSEMVVWGGVVGRDEDFDRLDLEWAAKLRNPLPGKPPLKKFSLRNCAVSEGEFTTYKPAERDALRFEMREIIQHARAKPRAYAVPVRVYNRVIRGRAKRAYGSADGMSFAACADWALQVAEAADLPLTCVFDKGQQAPWLDFLIADAEERASERGVKISYSFAAVADVCGLQAADTIATEHYWYALHLMKQKGAPPIMDPHLTSLIKMTNPDAYILTEFDMERMLADFRKQYPLRDWFMRRGPRRLISAWPSVTKP